MGVLTFDTVFLTGHRKCGTTMFHKLFDGHPSLTVYPVDLGLLYAYFPCFASREDASDEFLRERIELVLKKSLNSCNGLSGVGSPVFELDPFIKLFWRSMEGRDIRSRADIICAVGEAWYAVTCGDKSKPFLFKETSQTIHFSEIIEKIPNCKFIHIIRDPRDNYAALKSGVTDYYSAIGEGELETLASLINRARMDMLAASLYCKEAPDQFMALKFEDLTANPELEMRKVAEFIGIEFDDCMLHPTILGQRFEGNSHEGKKFTSISKENVGNWRKRIAAFEAQVIEFWLEDVMKMWQYERAFTSRECANSVGDFYKWYNCKFFFHDSFSPKLGEV